MDKIQEIRETIEVIAQGSPFEIAMIPSDMGGGEKIYRCLFDDVQKGINFVKNQIDRLIGHNFFIGVNTPDENKISSAKAEGVLNPAVPISRSGVNDSEISSYRNIFIDVDSKKAEGFTNFPSTDTEKAETLIVANEIIKLFSDACSTDVSEAATLADSGNGHHILLSINLPTEKRYEIESLLKSLRMKYDNVNIDTTVFNPARLTRFYGSINKKKSTNEERINRKSGIIKKSTRPLTEAEYNKIISTFSVKCDKKQLKPYQPEAIDLKNVETHTPDEWDCSAVTNFTDMYGIEVLNRSVKDDHVAYYVKCPWSHSHSTSSSISETAILVYSNNLPTFRCQHSHCAEKTWVEYENFYSENEFENVNRITSQQVYDAIKDRPIGQLVTHFAKPIKGGLPLEISLPKALVLAMGILSKPNKSWNCDNDDSHTSFSAFATNKIRSGGSYQLLNGYFLIVAPSVSGKDIGDLDNIAIGKMGLQHSTSGSSLEGMIDAWREMPSGIAKLNEFGNYLGSGNWDSGVINGLISIYNQKFYKGKLSNANKAPKRYLPYLAPNILANIQSNVLIDNIRPSHTESGAISRFMITVSPQISLLDVKPSVDKEQVGDDIDDILNIYSNISQTFLLPNGYSDNIKAKYNDRTLNNGVFRQMVSRYADEYLPKIAVVVQANNEEKISEESLKIAELIIGWSLEQAFEILEGVGVESTSVSRMLASTSKVVMEVISKYKHGCSIRDICRKMNKQKNEIKGAIEHLEYIGKIQSFKIGRKENYVACEQKNNDKYKRVVYDFDSFYNRKRQILSYFSPDGKIDFNQYQKDEKINEETAEKKFQSFYGEEQETECIFDV